MTDTAKKNPPAFGRLLRDWFVPVSMAFILLGLWLIVFAIGGLAAVTAWYLTQIFCYAGVLALVVGIILSIIRLARRQSIGPALIALIFLSMLATLPILWSWGLIPVAYPADIRRAQPALSIRSPLDVKATVAWGGDSLEVNRHAAVPDQRWAYDLLVPPAANGSQNLNDYGCYGLPVKAPAAGKVTSVRNTEKDETPGVLSNNITAPTGNHVILLADETATYLMIAHLKPGSVVVQEGQHVQEGDLLGQCGNSGNTSEPHVHIHHQRQNPLQFGNGFGEGLPLYFRNIQGPAMPQGGFSIKDEQVVFTGDTISPDQK